jgi:hypothetical protein
MKGCQIVMQLLLAVSNETAAQQAMLHIWESRRAIRRCWHIRASSLRTPQKAYGYIPRVPGEIRDPPHPASLSDARGPVRSVLPTLLVSDQPRWTIVSICLRNEATCLVAR